MLLPLLSLTECKRNTWIEEKAKLTEDIEKEVKEAEHVSKRNAPTTVGTNKRSKKSRQSKHNVIEWEKQIRERDGLL